MDAFVRLEEGDSKTELCRHSRRTSEPLVDKVDGPTSRQVSQCRRGRGLDAGQEDLRFPTQSLGPETTSRPSGQEPDEVRHDHRREEGVPRTSL